MRAQHPVAQAVERADPHAARVAPASSRRGGSSISFAALLVNVTARIDSGAACPVREQPCDARRQHARLAAAGAGEDQRGRVRQRDGGELLGIEIGEERRSHCRAMIARRADAAIRAVTGGYNRAHAPPPVPVHDRCPARPDATPAAQFRDDAGVRPVDPRGRAVRARVSRQDLRHRLRRRGRRRRRRSSASSTTSTCCTASASRLVVVARLPAADRGDPRAAGHREPLRARRCASPTPRRWTACSRPRARCAARIEALLSLGIANSPMAGARNRVSSGNYITAKPMGVVDGVDMQLTGEVRRIDTEAIQQRLDDGDIVLISPLGYSPTGEIFNLTRRGSRDAGRRAPGRAQAHLPDGDRRRAQRPPAAAHRPVDAPTPRRCSPGPDKLAPDVRHYLPCAIRACNNGVKRAHLISRHHRRRAAARALHARRRRHDGRRRRRSRTCAARRSTTSAASSRSSSRSRSRACWCAARASGSKARSSASSSPSTTTTIIGCAALYAFPGGASVGELAALAVHPDFRREGYGEALMHEIEARARKLQARRRCSC